MAAATPTVLRPIWLETDLEPDDLLAIYLLLKRGYVLDSVVVGEGNARTKERRMLAYWTMLRREFPQQVAPSPSVLRGLSSRRPFANDGKDIYDSPLAEVRALWPSDEVREKEEDESAICGAYQTALTAYLDRNEAPLLVLLKPMRELLVTWTSFPAHLRAKAMVAQYGSFNYRCLVSQQRHHTHADIEAMVRGFGGARIYESFLATGDRNSSDKHTMPLLHAALANVSAGDASGSSSSSSGGGSIFVSCLLRHIRIWNEHCLARCRRGDGDSVVSRGRAAKIAEAIESSIDTQMVLADSGLAVVLENPAYDAHCVPSDISLATGYTAMSARADSTVAVYVDVPFESLDRTAAALILHAA